MNVTAEQLYCKETSFEHRKKFAQFFTPTAIADFMCKWVLQAGTLNNVLEPAFGLGIFSRTLLKENHNLKIVGYDIDNGILKSAKDVFAKIPNVTLHCQDYLQSNWNDIYDGIICNPPYFKFHDYDNQTATSIIKQKLGYTLSGFTNLYAIFLLKSINQLSVGGRCAYIVPSEFLNADYGVAVKKYLITSQKLRHVIVFDFEKDVFEDAITTACILLCSNDNTNHSVSFSNVKSNIQLMELENALFVDGKELPNDVEYAAVSPQKKWREYYSGDCKTEFHNLVTFSTYAKVSRGIATGANNYFTFNQSKARRCNIPSEALLPCVCHCVDVKTSFFSDDDFANLENADKNVFLFNAQKALDNENVRDYILKGEELHVDKKFLTASRNPWYALEKRQPPEIWVTVFNREGLRFIRNTSKATNLTTFHSVYVNESYKELTDLLYAYLLTDTAHEIFDRNRREYGNGLRKFEPNDLNKGMILDIAIISQQDKEKIIFLLEKYKKGNIGSLAQIDTIIREYVSTEIAYPTAIKVNKVEPKHQQLQLELWDTFTDTKFKKKTALAN